MEFIGKAKNLGYTDVHGGKYEHLADGTWRQLNPSYHVRFRRVRALLPFEEQLARELFTFTGTYFLEDGVTPVDPVRANCSVFDTKWVPEQYREEVENWLLNSEFRDSEYFLSERPKAKPPWPGYSKIRTAQGKNLGWVAEQIASRVKDLELDPRDVIAFESQNENRAEVIAALEDLLGVEPDQVVVEVG